MKILTSQIFAFHNAIQSKYGINLLQVVKCLFIFSQWFFFANFNTKMVFFFIISAFECIFCHIRVEMKP